MTSNISTMNTLGINNHLKVVSSKMDTIIADLENPPTPIDVGLLNKEATQLLVKTALDTINTTLEGELSVNVITDYATETTLSAINTLLDDNISTGGFNVSITALDGEKITNTVIDTKRGLDVNIVNTELAVNTITGFATETTLGAIDTKLGEELLVNVISGFATETTLGAIDTKLGEELLVNVISGFATETTLGAIDTLLDENTSTGGFNVSITALNGDKITNTTNDSKIGLDTNIINTSLTVEGSISIVDAVNINILDTNSTIYDFTNDSSTMTEADNRFIIDRVRPDSWAFVNDKNQNGSNIYWYSNSSTSPLGVQEFNITHGDISSLYCVVSINKTENSNRLPFMALFSPSNTSFYNSRWIYTIDPSEYLLQTEKVLLYWNNDPVNIYTNLRHVELLLNVSASQGPRLETETIFLMSINTASGEPASSISYNAYNAGFILNNTVHNDYNFNSGIKSKGDLLLSNLNESSGNLGVNVSNLVGVNNDALTAMTFTTASNDSSINGLNVITRQPFYPTTFNFTENDISITDETPSIDLRAYNKLSLFGTSTHTGGGSHNIIIQYSNDDITFYDSPNVIASTGDKFAYDNSTFCVSYMRFKFQVELTDLTFIVSLK